MYGVRNVCIYTHTSNTSYIHTSYPANTFSRTPDARGLVVFGVVGGLGLGSPPSIHPSLTFPHHDRYVVSNMEVTYLPTYILVHNFCYPVGIQKYVERGIDVLV